MGFVVSAQEDDNDSFLLDDGTGNILIRFFEPPRETYELGTLVNVVGRPREWGNAKYITPELVKQVDDKTWLEVHQLQTQLQKKDAKKLPVEPQEQPDMQTGPYQKVLNTIALLDNGKGADVQEIVSTMKDADAEKLVSNLLEEGEIFEIAPGRVKLLE